jgi:hypothetical protein
MTPSSQGQWAPPQPPNTWIPPQGQQAPWVPQQGQAPWIHQQGQLPPAPPQWGPPPQQPGPWGPPPPPKKSKRIGLWIAIGAVAVIGIGGAAGISGNNDKPAAAKAPSSGTHSGTSSSTKKSPLDHSEDAAITSCSKDATTGFPTAKVKITNNSSKSSNYIVTVAFTSADGSVQYDTGLAAVDNLNPGQTTTSDASSLKDDVPAGFVCKIEDTTRLSAVG